MDKNKEELKKKVESEKNKDQTNNEGNQKIEVNTN